MSGPFVDNQGRGWKWWSYHLKSAFAVLLSIAILVTAVVLVQRGASQAWTAVRTTEDYLGEGKDPVEITIPAGSTMTDIGYILLDSDVIKSVKAYKKAVAELDAGKTIQAGRYALKTQMSAAAAVEVLTDPRNRIVRRVTIPEGYRLSRQFDIIVKGTSITKKDLDALVAKPNPVGLPGYAKSNMEGFLFPDTYEVEDTTTAAQLLKTMVTRYKTVTKEINFDGRAKATGISSRDALIIASILEREGGTDEDVKMMSGVIRNRLKAGMPLQMDSTVHYFTNTDSDGKVTTTNAQRETKNPYNTYLNKGLPPGPISAPGKVALEAAVNPPNHEFLFFVTVNLDTGETLYAKTYEEHQVNVKKFQQWCQENTGRC
ncbi:endolytic transglycosylase MltG [Aestuariimicrobium ganziense]|uniref:endolytic transglycosylase MltG n=1 Tax=Aestuariimicrobium ganziense TaxID=2773677 RepID=UPI0019423444|nr:endolytic transglycosylase MltG [Aestuariimicrobium ganziense]